jgi:hypothetical protein
MKTKVWIFLPGVLALVLVLCSCRKAGEAVGDIGPTGEKMKACFQCKGTGKMKCPDCRDGFVDCPGDCLKLTQGEWVHMKVDGHPSTDLWHKFEVQGGFTAFNQDHVGHIIKSINGDWIDSGKCPICHGTGKVECPKCKGTGEVTCTICDGKGVVPESWTAFDNPKLKSRPGQITLKNGKVLLGKKVFVFGSHTTIQTANGNVEVNTSDIVSESKPDGK